MSGTDRAVLAYALAMQYESENSQAFSVLAYHCTAYSFVGNFFPTVNLDSAVNVDFGQLASAVLEGRVEVLLFDHPRVLRGVHRVLLLP
eukprot:2179117-Rhodomonas_salina.5